MKLGIEIKIDVKKILKDRLYQGTKGTYLTMTTFIDTDNPGNYGDHGFISQSVSKEEREEGIKTPILGNCKVFYGIPQQNQPQNSNQGQNTQGYQPQNQNGYNQPNQNQNGQQSGQNQSQGSDSDIPF